MLIFGGLEERDWKHWEMEDGWRDGGREFLIVILDKDWVERWDMSRVVVVVDISFLVLMMVYVKARIRR